MTIKNSNRLNTEKQNILNNSNENVSDFMNTGIGENILAEIRILAEKYNIDKVILFGSRARGSYKATSDIDLAVSGGDVSGFSLSVDEDTSTLVEFDFVNLDGGVQEELCSSIQKEGRILYEKV